MSQVNNHKRVVLEKHFREVMERASEIVGSDKQVDIAKAWEVEPNTLNGWKTRGFPDGMLYKFAYLHDLNYEWIAHGTGSREKYGKPDGEKVVVLKHMDVARNSIDSETYFKLNINLQIIEKFDTHEFFRLYKNVESIANYLNRKNQGGYDGKNRRQGERRSGDDGTYNGHEHRSGKDRRRVS